AFAPAIVRRGESDSGEVGIVGDGFYSKRAAAAAGSAVAAASRCSPQRAARSGLHRMIFRVLHMVAATFSSFTRLTLLASCMLFTLTGCETITGSMGKKIDYKSVSSAPALEIPPDLTTPAYDDRYNVSTASGVAARAATRPRDSTEIAPNI